MQGSALVTTLAWRVLGKRSKVAVLHAGQVCIRCQRLLPAMLRRGRACVLADQQRGVHLLLVLVGTLLHTRHTSVCSCKSCSTARVVLHSKAGGTEVPWPTLPFSISLATIPAKLRSMSREPAQGNAARNTHHFVRPARVPEDPGAAGSGAPGWNARGLLSSTSRLPSTAPWLFTTDADA
jgi:hypothetical protein